MSSFVLSQFIASTISKQALWKHMLWTVQADYIFEIRETKNLASTRECAVTQAVGCTSQQHLDCHSICSYCGTWETSSP